MSETVLMGPPAALTPVPTAAPPSGPLADLILARLLAAKSSLGPKQVHDDIAPQFKNAPSMEQVKETLTALRTAGLVAEKGQSLTETGRAQALVYLGITELPPKANWGTVKAKFLVPKALGLSAASADDAKVFGNGEKLAALLLKRQLGLPVGTGATLNAVFQAIACRVLSYPNKTSLADLIPDLLGKAIGGNEPIDMKTAEKVVPRVLLNTRANGMQGLRGVLLQGWIDGEITAREKPEPPPIEPDEIIESFDLESFANTVKSEARSCPTGRFGDNKVFISHVWRQLKDQPQIAPLGLDGFKEKLLAANRLHLLTLSRADLVQFMDPNDVRDSATEYLGSEFHFVLIEKE